MAWRKNLRPASFRGVPFFVDGSQFTSGRRVVLHEYPDRDDPYSEDLGRIGKTWKVDGHILGENYDTLKKKLIKACEEEGPGELIHPYYGTLKVNCGAISIDEDTKEGGIAKVSFQFYESGDNRYPKKINGKIGQLLNKAQAATSAAKKAFDTVMTISKLPGHAVDSMRAAVAAATEAFNDATSGVATIADNMADLAYSLRNLKAETNDLLQSPAKLSQRLLDSLALLESACSTSKGRYDALQTLFDFGNDDTPIPTTTPTREREAENKQVFDDFIQQAALIEATIQTGEIEFQSVEEASEVREFLRDLIELQIETTTDDDLFQALKDLLAELVSLLPDVDTDIPSIQNITLEQTTPAIIVAYDLFESPFVEEDFISRNKIAHPGFVPPGIELEIINAEAPLVEES